MNENATNKDIADAIERGVNTAMTSGLPLWLGATEEVIKTLTDKGDCYTSGKVASYLRTFRPDLSFAVSDSIGRHVRDAFYNGQLPHYIHDDGSVTPVEMVPRQTMGFTRTPVGTEVFVYGKTAQLCLDDAFEVEIPKPGIVTPADPGDAHGLPAKPVQSASPVQIVKAPPVPQSPMATYACSVHTDARLCVPRAAIEALLQATGASINIQTQLHVQIDGNEALVSLSPTAKSTPYKLSMTRGRVLFTNPTTPFNPGDSFDAKVDVTRRGLVIKF